MNEKWIGNGTLENPYVIDSHHSFSDESVINNSSLNIVIRNTSFTSLILKRCNNLKFENCAFGILALPKSSNITLKGCKFKETLELRYTSNSYIQDSFIQFMIFSMCHDNHFKTCTINRIYNHFSKANTFENISTPADLNTILGVGTQTSYKKYVGLIVAAVILLIWSIFFVLYSFPDLFIGTLIGGIFLIGCFTILIPVALYHDYREMRNYPDNVIF